jgi:hypothetical protein
VEKDIKQSGLAQMNFESKNQADGSVEKLKGDSEYEIKSKKTLIILVVLSVLLVLAGIGYLGLARLKVEMPVELPTGLLPEEVDCNLSGQKAEVDIKPDVVDEGNGPELEVEDKRDTVDGDEGSDAEGHPKIIARLLRKDPLIIEVLDDNSWSSRLGETVSYIDGGLSVSRDAVDELDSLKFGDIFEAKEYSYMTGGFGVGIGYGLYGIKKVEGEPVYYHQNLSNFPWASRSGVLIDYYSNQTGQLKIFRDGLVYYEDNDRNSLVGERLTVKEINSVLRVFRKANFESLESKEGSAYHKPRLTLICNKYQWVTIEGNEEALNPITQRLDKLILSLRENFEYRLKYASKQQVQVTDWPLADTPLKKVIEYRDEAQARFRKTGAVDRQHPAFTKIPDDLAEILPIHNTQRFPGPFFRSEGITYIVDKTSTGSKTFYALDVREIIEPDEELGGLNLWPAGLGIKLEDISSEGFEITKNTYDLNQDFFDMLAKDFGGRFLEGEYIYERVKFYRIDPRQIVNNDKLMYVLKENSKGKLIEWPGKRSLSDYPGSIHTDKEEEKKTYEEIKNVIPAEIEKLKDQEARVYIEDEGKYYMLRRYWNTIFISRLPKSSADEGFFTGYLVWDDTEVKLSEIREEVVKVSKTFIDKNKLKFQLREDKYYIEGDYVYILELSGKILD